VTRVLVVAGSPVVRAGLESILLHEGAGSRFSVVGSTSRSTGLAEQIEELEPDVVLVELPSADEPPMLGAERGVPPAFVVLVNGEVADAEWIRDALQQGVLAVLPREAGSAEIVAAVAAAAAGLVTLHPSLVDALTAPFEATPASMPSGISSEAQPEIRPTRPIDGRGDLTPREIEVLRMLAEGLANKQIAARLGISEHTVKFHIASVYAKLGASSRTEAVRLGVRRGVVVL
jgi:two-component system, NarL family, response regulator YdfI